MRRLFIWDFDDTLVYSSDPIERSLKEFPDVSLSDWWQNPHYRYPLAHSTVPVMKVWKKLLALEGDHWVLSGSTREIIDHWMSTWSPSPIIARGINKIKRIISVKFADLDQIPARKREVILMALSEYDEIHIFDDNMHNLSILEGLNVVRHHVTRGQIKQAAVNTSFAQKVQDIELGIRILQNILPTIKEKTHLEIIRSTISVLRGEILDTTSQISTFEFLTQVSETLKRSGISFESPISDIASSLEEHRELSTRVTFKNRTRDFYGLPPGMVERAIFSLVLAIMLAFDRLQTDFVCVVDKMTFPDGGLYPTGALISIQEIKRERD